MTTPAEAEHLAWLNSPHTARLRTELREELPKQLAYLLRECAGSADPVVRAALALYRSKEELLNMLEKGTIR